MDQMQGSPSLGLPQRVKKLTSALSHYRLITQISSKICMIMGDAEGGIPYVFVSGY